MSLARRGFSLLEVILALAILTGAIAVLGELARQGVENARRVRELSQAQLLCESMLAQLQANLTTIEASSGVTLETDDPDHTWLADLEVQDLDEQGLKGVRVTVREDSSENYPISCSLTRWLIDPSYVSSNLTSNSTSGNSTSSSGSTNVTGNSTK